MCHRELKDGGVLPLLVWKFLLPDIPWCIRELATHADTLDWCGIEELLLDVADLHLNV
jgi:hypothetical protein